MIVKRQIGKLFIAVFFFVPGLIIAQCPNIKNLKDIFQNNESPSSLLNLTYIETKNSIIYQGFDLKKYNYQSYSSNDNSIVLQLEYNQLMQFETSNNLCFSNIKAQVAKEVGNKVNKKVDFEKNGWKIESFKHMNEDIYFEFHRSITSNKFKVLIISGYRYDAIKNELIEREAQEQRDKEIKDFISKIQNLISENKYSEADRELNFALSRIENLNVSESIGQELRSLDNEIQTKILAVYVSEIKNLAQANSFLKAKSKIKELRGKLKTRNSAVESLDTEVNKLATDYFSYIYLIEKNQKRFENSLIYIDSVLMFDPYNTKALSDKSEIKIIKNYLIERQTKVYNLWDYNTEQKNKITKDYSDLCISFISKSQTNGYLKFDLTVETDTACGFLSNVIWASPINSEIVFDNDQIKKYNLKPYEKFGYCSNSIGILSFNYNWNYYKSNFKYLNGKVKKANSNNKPVVEYLLKSYPYVSGFISYTKKETNYNDQISTVYTISDFKTRGPLNAIYSLIIPGIGTLRTSYGKKGWGRLTTFVISTSLAISSKIYSNSQYKSYLSATNQKDMDVYYSNANFGQQVFLVLGGLSATISLYDFIWVLNKGSKNLRNSKSLQERLKDGPIIIQKF